MKRLEAEKQGTGQQPMLMELAYLPQGIVVNLSLIWGSFVIFRMDAFLFSVASTPSPASPNSMQATIFLSFHKSWCLRNECLFTRIIVTSSTSDKMVMTVI